MTPADDDVLLREDLASLLERRGFDVVGQCGEPTELLAALDLPLKVLVWADGDQTKLSYDGPHELAARYGLSDELAARLSAIDAVADAVIEQ